ncbi:MAG: dipeptide epimerase [Saprospiraceae bacterium]|nr:dipeptide epimerase [Saprospiraceae bacterium]
MLDFKVIYLKKRFPLRISRGVMTGSDNLFVSVTKNGLTGWGEMAPGEAEGAGTAEEGKAILEKFVQDIHRHLSVYEIYELGRREGIAPCVLAALDIALWDQLAKSAQLPLYKMLGLPLPKMATSVTIGINPPEVIRERVPMLLEGTGVKSLKIKLGSPNGIEADKQMFLQVVASAKKYPVNLRVDANGGWSVDDAIQMIKWLADQGAEYVEQPLKEGAEEDLPYLFKNRSLPIFIDESCRFFEDIPRLAPVVDGVNLKLMKCGGITGALRIIATARAFKLKTMIGCMGESSLSISAGAAISGIIDYIDLDSHLNLDPDPCTGAQLIDGIIVPNDQPGHGASIKAYDQVE